MTSTTTGGFRSVLRLPAFRQLWLSQLFALTAQSGIHFVQLILIERLTGSSVQIGLMIAAFSLPPVIFSFLAGAVVDRVPKKWIIVIANLLRGTLALSYLLLLQVLDGTALVISVYLITFLGSSVGAFFNPAVMSKIPLVVGEDRLMVANSLFNVTIAGSQFLGLIMLAPAAVKLGGLGVGFALMGSFYYLAFFFALFLPRDRTRHVQGVTAASGWQRMRSEFAEGWRFVVSHPAVRLAILQLVLIATLIMILAMIAPGFSARVLGLSPEDAVIVFAPAGLGMLVAIAFLGRWGGRFPQAWLQAAMLMVTAVSFGVLAYVSRDYGSLRIPIFDIYPQRLFPLTSMVAITALFMGFGLYSVNTIAQTVVQRRTPAALRGRVFTVQFMLANLIGLIPLFIAAISADILGIPSMIRGIAFACFGVGILTIIHAYRTRTVARRNSPAPPT
ncbi:MAG: MFS transporter [Caldilineales bacterium]|nr:MFS transporter [Caldilineales bacterium]